MAQECMAIFEHAKLPTVANVEQVCRETPIHCGLWLININNQVLRNWFDSRRQNTEKSCGRNGSPLG